MREPVVGETLHDEMMKHTQLHLLLSIVAQQFGTDCRQT